MSLTKSDLIRRLTERLVSMQMQDIELAARSIVDQMADSLAQGQRIEIRGFGSFSTRYRKPRVGRNPKTGEAVSLAGKHVLHFKPGKELKERVDNSKSDIQS